VCLDTADVVRDISTKFFAIGPFQEPNRAVQCDRNLLDDFVDGQPIQVMQKVEGHVSFHTAMSTAFPQTAPGTAPSPGPMKVEADRLRQVLGLSRMSFHDVNHSIAITDAPLEDS
jgi:hypothetical protein